MSDEHADDITQDEPRRLIERLVECHEWLARNMPVDDQLCKTIREAREWLAAQ